MYFLNCYCRKVIPPLPASLTMLVSKFSETPAEASSILVGQNLNMQIPRNLTP